MDAAITHARQASKEGLESMGLLLGEVYSHDGTQYVEVHDYITAHNDSTAISVRFTPEAFSQLARQLSKRHRDQLITGWCHSHPSYGCFLSSTDLSTQRRFFPEPWHVALVIDPLSRGENGVSHKLFKLNADSYAEAPYAVVRKR